MDNAQRQRYSRSQTTTKSSPTQPPENEIARVVKDLNHLLVALGIPIHIITPVDLTPSLLVAILEGMIGQKLPPIASGPTNGTPQSNGVQKVKLFLGVLETDILQEDVGLSCVDPRKLAVGTWGEAWFVARVICIAGERLGFLKVEREKHLDSTISRLWKDKKPKETPTNTSIAIAATKSPVSVLRSPSLSPSLQPSTSSRLPRTNRSKESDARPTRTPRTSDGPNQSHTWRDNKASSSRLLRPGSAPQSTSTSPVPTSSSTHSHLRRATSPLQRSNSPFQSQPNSQPSSTRFSTPELDTASVFYAPSTSNTRDTQTGMSLFDAGSRGDRSSVTSPPRTPPRKRDVKGKGVDHGTPSSVALSLLPPFQSPPPRPRSCIHDVQTPSLLLSVDGESPQQSRRHYRLHSQKAPPSQVRSPGSIMKSPTIERELDETGTYPRKVSVRYSGYIEPVDQDWELASYEASRSYSSNDDSELGLGASAVSPPIKTDTSILAGLEDSVVSGVSTEVDTTRGGHEDDIEVEGTSRTIAAIHEEYERTLKLLNERAQLLKELADLDISAS